MSICAGLPEPVRISTRPSLTQRRRRAITVKVCLACAMRQKIDAAVAARHNVMCRRRKPPSSGVVSPATRSWLRSVQLQQAAADVARSGICLSCGIRGRSRGFPSFVVAVDALAAAFVALVAAFMQCRCLRCFVVAVEAWPDTVLACPWAVVTSAFSEFS